VRSLAPEHPAIRHRMLPTETPGLAGRLTAALLYVTGIRLMECVRLRVLGLDFGYGQIKVRQGKGGKDRGGLAVRSPLTGLSAIPTREETASRP
jgi:integrase